MDSGIALLGQLAGSALGTLSKFCKDCTCLPRSPSGYAKFWTGTTSIFVKSETEIEFNIWVFLPLFLETQTMDKTERSYMDRALKKQYRGFASVNSSEICIALLCNDYANCKGIYNAL